MADLDISGIDGFRKEPVPAPDGGGDYTGRLRLTNVQWVSNIDEHMVTCTVTARQLRDWSEAGMLWTDQNMQRGVKAEAPPGTRTLLPLREGYPDPALYVFHSEKSDAMAQLLIEGRKLFLSPLTWNLRPGAFEGYFDPNTKTLTIYQGQVFLPDSHHRHQAIIRAMAVADDSLPGEFDAALPDRQFTVNLYFLSAEDEGEFFYEKNILGTPTAKSKAFDLTDQDAAASIAKKVVEFAPSLLGNVNRVTDRLTARNRHVVTLSTLRGFVEAAVDVDAVSRESIEELGKHLASFYEALAQVRPELGQLDLADRVVVRRDLMTDQAVLIHAYGRIGKKFMQEVQTAGDSDQVIADWRLKFSALSAGRDFAAADFVGDFFSRENPVWQQNGILQLTKSGGLTVSNTRQTRERAAGLIADLLELNA